MRAIHKRRSRAGRRLAGGVLLLVVLAVGPGIAGTNACEAARIRATEAERDGRPAEAIAAYEALLAEDTAFKDVVAPRLVALHTRLGQEAPALSWAARGASRHPAPAAYLAGVHAQLGQFKDAELALREALRHAPDPDSRLPLLWQLAEAQEKLGDLDAARDTLHQARDKSLTADHRQASGRRLEALARRHSAGGSPAPTLKDGEGAP
jgi:tetratricopeptide (TPR) repeat protein